MTEDEIIEMARQAGFSGSVAKMWAIYFEAFAHLVAAKAEAKEREACAMVCEVRAEEEVGMAYEGIALDCAKAIRARGQA